MPKRGKERTDAVQWRGFVRCELNSKRKEQYANWNPPKGSTEDLVTRFLSPGYKLSFSLDTYHDCVQASISCMQAGDANAGLTLTARGSTIESALRVLIFKHDVVLEGNWDNALPADADYDDIG